MTQSADQLTAYEVRNGARIIRFEGVLLAEVTSKRSSSPRWTEMQLFRTERGFYVIHRLGGSSVYHASDCVLAKANKLQYGADLPGGPPPSSEINAMSPCPSCRPLVTDGPETLRFERERHWAGVAETPEAAVSMLHRNDGGARSLPWVAANLLAEASKKDEPLALAYGVEQL